MDSAPAHDAAAAASLLGDPVFAALANEAVLDYLDWDELTRRPLPPGLSAEDTWRMLTTLRRFGAIRLPIQDLQGREYWYTLTREGRLCVDAVERYCRSDSTIHRAIQHRHGQRLLVESRVRDAIAVCQLDGVIVDAAEASRMLMGGRAARTGPEQLVLNVYRLIGDIDDWSGQPFTPAMLREIYARIIAGVVLEPSERTAVRHGIAERMESDPVSAAELERVLSQYCDYANQRTGDAAEPVAMKAHALVNIPHYWSFFPDFNGTFGRVIFREFAARQDYPVLGYLPVASMYKAWVDRRDAPSFVRFSTLDIPRTVADTNVDYTPDVITYLQLTVAALDEMLNAIEYGRERDAQVRSVLEHDPEINYRQRAVIARALAHPDRVFRIKEHQTAHNVVYATARADLLDLVDRGYLVQETQGKAFVFAPSPGLAMRLGAQGDLLPLDASLGEQSPER